MHDQWSFVFTYKFYIHRITHINSFISHYQCSQKHEKEPRNKLYSLSLEPLEIAEFVSVSLPRFSEIEICVSFF